ncbi:MAG TPA: glycosyltransferase family 4 protein [Chloroflexia bacterium]|nr:glycosyltransferase family 4 protein [Chloroflexia bacterium]
MKKVRLLLVITQSETGGAQKYVRDLATGLPREQYEVKVVCGGNSKLVTDLQREGVEVTALECLVREINPVKDWKAFTALRKIIKAWQPRIVHTNSSKAGLLGRLAARSCNTPVILHTAHGFVLSEPLSLPVKTFYWIAEKAGAIAGNHTIAVSESDRRLALRFGLTAPSKITTIYNGIEIQPDESPAGQFEDLRLAAGLPPEKKLVGTVANFYPTKGLSYFISACAQVKKVFPDCHFVLIGDGEERALLERQVQELELCQDVTFKGRCEDAWRMMHSLDVFVISSVKEGLPFSLLEAMAQERPIVATRVGGIPEVLREGEFGRLVAAGEPQALAKEIIDLLEHPAAARELGRQARCRVLESFTLDKMISSTHQLYQKQLAVKGDKSL